MKTHIITAIALLITLNTSAQIFRTNASDNTLVNSYGNELQALTKKYGITRAFGFSKSITNREGMINETVVVFYVDENGETQDKMVSARILHYNEVVNETKTSVPNPNSQSNVHDTITIVRRDTVMVTTEEIINPDSLTFKAKRVIKNQSGYLITGNIRDRGNNIPIVLSTYKRDEVFIVDGIDRRFSNSGLVVFNGATAVCLVFNPAREFKDKYLIKVISKNINNLGGLTGLQNDKVYAESFIVNSDFWNSKKYGMAWERQLQYMRENFGAQ